MLRLVVYAQSLLRKDEGQDLLEYALLVALIAIVAIAGVTAAGLKVDQVFKSIAEKISLGA
jgi:pilus assembly protein Flp/PilA